jgi:quinol monooxygenase YgiN
MVSLNVDRPCVHGYDGPIPSLPNHRKDEPFMIIIHAVFHLIPSQTEEFLQEIQTLIQASRAEEGNISYSLCKDTEKEHSYIMVEVWRSPEVVASHNASAPFTAFVAKAGNYLQAPLEIHAFQGEPLGTV